MRLRDGSRLALFGRGVLSLRASRSTAAIAVNSPDWGFCVQKREHRLVGGRIAQVAPTRYQLSYSSPSVQRVNNLRPEWTMVRGEPAWETAWQVGARLQRVTKMRLK